MPNKKNLNAFRLIRIARDMDVNELASELRVTPAYIYAIEKGTKIPSKRLLSNYCFVLGVSETTMQKLIRDVPDAGTFENALLLVLERLYSEKAEIELGLLLYGRKEN